MILRALGRLVREDTGQDLIEYALLAAFISIASIAAMLTLGSAIKTRYEGIATGVASAP